MRPASSLVLKHCYRASDDLELAMEQVSPVAPTQLARPRDDLDD